MRFRNLCMGVVFLFLVLFLNGCDTGVTDLTDEENGLVAEYVANVLISHNKNDAGRLEYNGTRDAVEPDRATTLENAGEEGLEDSTNMEEEGLPEEEPNDALPEEAPQTEVTAEPETIVDVSQIYSDYGIGVELLTSELCSDYMEEDDAFVISAKGNGKLLVAVFQVKNAHNDKSKIDLREEGIRYGLQSPRDGNEYQAAVTWLSNGGLNHFNSTLPKKGSEKALLVFEVPKDFSVEGATITVRRGEETARLVL